MPNSQLSVVRTAPKSVYDRKYDLSLIPQQALFYACQKPFPAYMGGYNNGKTFVLCLKILDLLRTYDHTRGVLGRAKRKDLETSTLACLFDVMGCTESTIRLHPWVQSWNASRHLLRLKNGSELYGIPLENKDAWSSIEGGTFGFAAIDQVEQVPEEAFGTLLGRVKRNAAAGCPKWIGVVGNPAGHNWVWERWKRDQGTPNQNPNYYLVEASTYDNPFRDPEYIKDQAEFLGKDSAAFKRVVHGSWDAFVGQVYDEFRESVHVIDPFMVPDNWKICLTSDLGWADPTVFLWWAVDWDGNYHVYQEHYHSYQLPSWHSDRIKSMGILDDKGRQMMIYADPAMMQTQAQSGKCLKEFYSEEGIMLTPAFNRDKLGHIMKVKQMLRIDNRTMNPYTGKIGCPHLFIHSNCINTIEEFKIYRWQETQSKVDTKSDKPEQVVKKKDHAMDCIRYFVGSWLSNYVPVKNRVLTLHEAQIESMMVANESQNWLLDD